MCCNCARLSPHLGLFRNSGSYSGTKRTLGAEELSGDVEGLSADNDNLLAVEQLLGDNGGQATQEVALAIDDDLEEAIMVSIA